MRRRGAAPALGVAVAALLLTTLKDDPVLHGASGVNPYVSTAEPVICASGAAPGQPTTGVPTRLRLPSDVIFAFGSAALTPAVGSAIKSLTKQVPATSGTVVIVGHTDAIGDDASNERPSGAACGLGTRRAGRQAGRRLHVSYGRLRRDQAGGVEHQPRRLRQPRRARRTVASS